MPKPTSCILIILALSLSACTSLSHQLKKDAYAQDQLYQGYPCQDHCQPFQIGYDHAEASQFTDYDQCTSDSFEENTGCKVYINEYNFENQTFEELISGDRK